MKGTLSPVFPSEIAAIGAIKRVTRAIATKYSRHLDHPTEAAELSAALCNSYPIATIHSQELSRILFTMGLAGAFTGCLAGFIGLVQIPGRDAMYLVMVPLGSAFTGMTLGFLAAIGLNQFARWQETAGSKAYLSNDSGRVEAIFASHEDGGNALAALINAGVSPGKISVIGEDCDSFRQATASLHSKKINKSIVWMGVLGAIVGSLAGFAGMPALTHVASPLISAVSGVVAGLVLGLYTGVAIGGMMFFDNIPASDAHFQLGTPDQGDMVVGVVTSDEQEQELVNSLLCEHALPAAWR
jgi:hypothetical protein